MEEIDFQMIYQKTESKIMNNFYFYIIQQFDLATYVKYSNFFFILHQDLVSNPITTYQLLCYIYQPIKMLAQQLEAQQNLCSFSQKTNYIVDWTERPINRYINEYHKQAILQEREEGPTHRPTIKKMSGLNREVSEKYYLRKNENKLEIINQIEYPMIDRTLFRSQEHYALPKNSVNPQITSSPTLKRKNSTNSNFCGVVDMQFLNKKLQIFQRKHSESQKNIKTHIQNTRNRPTPRSLNIKRGQKTRENKVQKIMLNLQELEHIKKMISKNSRRYSVPNIRQAPQFPILNL